MTTAMAFVFWFVNVFPKYRARFETWHAGGFKSDDQLTLGWLFILTLAGVSLWAAYKLFMLVCTRLDERGHWDRRIAGRKSHWF
jgi:hypothetical protein